MNISRTFTKLSSYSKLDILKDKQNENTLLHYFQSDVINQNKDLAVISSTFFHLSLASHLFVSILSCFCLSAWYQWLIVTKEVINKKPFLNVVK